MSDELKPCPFCGSTEVMAIWDGNAASITCACSGTGPYAWMDDRDRTKGRDAEVVEDAIRMWNTHPVEDALRAELEALRAKWAAVPWNEITRATWQLEERTDLRETIEAWIMAHNEQAKATE